jgi:hypothetical protein
VCFNYGGKKKQKKDNRIFGTKPNSEIRQLLPRNTQNVILGRVAPECPKLNINEEVY